MAGADWAWGNVLKSVEGTWFVEAAGLGFITSTYWPLAPGSFIEKHMNDLPFLKKEWKTKDFLSLLEQSDRQIYSIDICKEVMRPIDILPR